MKTFTIIALWLLATASYAHGQDDDDSSFSNCAVTKFTIANRKAIVSADVIKYTKLGSGQGTMDCLNLCRAMDECYAFNYLQRSKWCYILSGADRMRRRRRAGWASGVKRCVDHSNNDPWDNTPYDSADAKPTNLVAIADVNQQTFVATWKPPDIGARYGGTLSYKFKCGPNTPLYSCDQKGWSTGYLTTNSLSKSSDRTAAYNAFRDQFPGSKCYVEAYLAKLKVSCSRAAIVSIIPSPWFTIDSVDCKDVTASWESPFDGIESWELSCESSNGGAAVSDTFSGSDTTGTVTGLSIARTYVCSLTGFKGDDSLSVSAAEFTTVRDVDAGCDCDSGVTGTSCNTCDVGFTGSGSSCTECDVGTYKDQPGSAACSSCDPGFSTSGTGSTSSEDCNICAAGYGGDGTTCTECTFGEYKISSGNVACQQCADNKTTELEGSTSASACVCAPGFGLDSETCTACTSGTYQDSYANVACASCSLCTEAFCEPNYCGPDGNNNGNK